MLITGCVLAKNEGDKLEECLSQVSDISDEIIVVDNGSTDNTREIAKKFGCKILYLPDVVLDEGRNAYLEAAKCPWIFILDADERITDEGKKEIRKAAQQAKSNVAGFQIPRLEYTGSGKWAYTVITRLVRNHPKIRYDKSKIHSRLRGSVQSIGKIELINSPIHHFGILYENANSNKRQRYVNLILEEINLTNDKEHLADLYKYLGLEYACIGKVSDAREQYRKAMKLSSIYNPICKFYLALTYIFENDLNSAENLINSLLSLETNIRPKLLNAKAEIYFRKGKIDDSIKMCLESMKLEPFASYNFINLAALLENSNPLKAIEYLKMAIKLNPYILDDFIYKKVSAPNVYLQQNVVLSCVRTANSHMKRCEENLNKLTKN